MNLKVERAKRNLSQEQLSIISGVCRLTISNIERKGIENVQIKIVRKIATALDIPISQFFED
ncbi:helix-turn-helix domain-containing protein [Clostridium chromiireducens]|uniref:helix-turn-helix domain-containing protein n=1 Tax=Clostridium chromiireducens TaxID=225345 RepID=UPI003AF68D86